MKTPFGRLLVGLALLVSSCSTVDFEQQELKLTHDQETDSLTLDISYRGLIAGSSGLDVACAWMQGMVDKRPRFIVLGWPFEFDLEQIGDEWLLGQVDVLRAELTFEKGPSMDMEQRIRLQSVQEAIVRANAAISAEVLSSYAEADLEREAKGWMDVKTLELILAHARRGGPWISLENGSLGLHFPCSQGVFHTAIMTIADPPKMEDAERALLRQALGQLGGVSYAKELLIVSFPISEDVGLQLTGAKDLSSSQNQDALILEFSGK
ncbi:MAG TPA: hypothetical protein EYQ74_12765 [Planctomycetes bacterium]|nr:hypothetical protein [Planctomycetota bacterium]HIK62061.1 hypothetical protein [Planctomycetota bacterium]